MPGIILYNIFLNKFEMFILLFHVIHEKLKLGVSSLLSKITYVVSGAAVLLIILKDSKALYISTSLHGREIGYEIIAIHPDER